MKHIILCVSLITLFFIGACKKNQLGGSSEISGTVAHHGKPIPNAVVYIKFNATEFPGDDVSLYNAQVNADANGAYSFKCYKGSYYFYAVGFDSSLPATVSGGLSLKPRTNEKIKADLAVTE